MTGTTSFTRFDRDVAIRYAHKASDYFDKDYYYTTEPFTYHIDEYPSNMVVTVPVGFLTDGAKIPRAFWFWASPIGKHAQSAILHDYLCEYLTIQVDGNPTKITRKEADAIFKESLLILGVSKFKANLMYLGVSAYRKAMRVTKPSFNLVKRTMEEEIRIKLLSGRSVEQDEVLRISVV